ncbi:phospholipid carrier-dependent glycosyltransferase [Tessaracoccus sp. MC1865]|uniref:dolichyl-phosphate-mannose--protein mannosyltransferase n=1 Tax=Tessaracoccus sp. MC1865 TaxID=2760310 RepID=UPI001600B3CC|nr:phospholipid carrier-dependent glycosyltransferase [Tessaracoccus sp. MC1865]MBB1482457.1 phospholipid carrier-dependent glycosyltransferase [Tessaracoccus sp. MC1865]QTO38087.1 phospholipid carrier-dependent glycosyltransferase [Tessaracoccus sp. MC1865]
MGRAYDACVQTTLTALDDGKLRDRTVGWIVTISITLMAFALRFYNIGFPHKVLFDETYYAKDGWAIMQSGYERNWADGANDLLLKGDLSGMEDTAAFVVHPPLGKILIGLGETMFGMNPFGWRFMALIFGTLLVFLTIRLARRVSRSTLIGAVAGLLLTFDGLAFVMSRLALLDIFQATLAVAAIAALVADRDWFRHRLAHHLRKNNLDDLGGQFGPLMLLRPWRIAAGVLFGLSCAVKWNSIYVLAVFGIVTVVWDLGARQLAGARHRKWLSLVIDAPAAFVQLVVVAVPVYIATWWGWLSTSGGYSRDWGEGNPDHPLVKLFGKALGSLMWYHHQAYEFHTSDKMMTETTHTYQSHPASWILMLRPIGIEAENDIQPGTQGCEAVGDTCMRIISGMGTPVLWWAAALALLAGLYWWIIKRDWRFAVPVLALGAAWLPWFQYADRPIFFFYAIMMIPFSSIALAMAIGKILGPPEHPKRRVRAIVAGLIVALVIVNFAYLYPVLTAELVSRSSWWARMWLGNTWV